MLQVSVLIRTPSAPNDRNPMQVNHNFPQPSKASSVHTVKVIQLSTSKRSRNRAKQLPQQQVLEIIQIQPSGLSLSQLLNLYLLILFLFVFLFASLLPSKNNIFLVSGEGISFPIVQKNIPQWDSTQTPCPKLYLSLQMESSIGYLRVGKDDQFHLNTKETFPG